MMRWSRGNHASLKTGNAFLLPWDIGASISSFNGAIHATSLCEASGRNSHSGFPASSSLLLILNYTIVFGLRFVPQSLRSQALEAFVSMAEGIWCRSIHLILGKLSVQTSGQTNRLIDRKMYYGQREEDENNSL